MKPLTNIDHGTLYVLSIFLIAGTTIAAYHQYDILRYSAQENSNADAFSNRVLFADTARDGDAHTAMTPPPEARDETARVATASAGGIVSFATTKGVFPRQTDTYQIAFDNYESKRLQFDNCIATSPIMNTVFTGGTEVMIEGKSYDPQMIHIGEQSILLLGYDFAIVPLPRVTEKETLQIDCEVNEVTQYNVMTLTLYP